MGDVERKFQAAVGVIKNLPPDGPYQPSNEMKLKFYAHFKQATQGPCLQARPGFWDVIGRAKHDAWAGLGNIGKQEAMQGYVNLLSQIVETMNYTADVERFMEVVGPFYEFVDDAVLHKFNITRPQKDSTSLLDVSPGRPGSGSSLPEVPVISLPIPEEVEVDEEGGRDLTDMLGNYAPRQLSHVDNSESDHEYLITSSPDQNHNSLLTIKPKEEGNCEDTLRLEEELLAARQELESTQSLMEEIRSMRAIVEGETGKKQLAGKEQLPGEGSLTQQQVDQLLQRFDGFVPQPESAVVDTVSAAVDSAVAIGLEGEESDSEEEEIFEDSMDFNPGCGLPMLESSDHSNSELTRDEPASSPSLSSKLPGERKLSSVLRHEQEEEDQILIVRTHHPPEGISCSCHSSPCFDRFLSETLERLSQDISSLDFGLQEVGRRLAGIETSVQEVRTRLSSLEYLMHIVIAGKRSRGERILSYIGLPLATAGMLLLFKALFSFRRSGAR